MLPPYEHEGMVRHTDADADVDPEDWDEDRLLDYIGEVGPLAAELPDGEYAEPVLSANVEAVVAELKARKGNDVETDGGHLTGDDRSPSDAEVDFGESVDAFEDAVGKAVADGGQDPVDEAVDGDHYLRHADDESSTFRIRHDRSVRTRVDDGDVVHTIVESVDDDAHTQSLSWSRTYFDRCPACGEDVDGDADDGDTYVETWSCEACPWELRRASDGVPNTVADDTRSRPLWSKTTYPHDFDDDADVDFESVAESSDTKAEAANLIRDLYLSLKAKALGTFNDAAYVSSEWEGEGDDREKVADAYIDTTECGKCGDVVDAPATSDHAHFGDVCPACEGATVWSVDDADLPDDVVDRMADHKTFGKSNIVALLRDVMYWGNYVAAVDDRKDSTMFDADDDVDPDDVPPVKTGKQGRRDMGMGKGGRPGTGLRRPNGFAHNNRYFRTVLRDAEDTGLIRRVQDDPHADVDDPDLRWEATDTGRRVFDELSRCATCGEKRVPMLRSSSYKVGRSVKKDHSLTTACPTCDDLRSGSDGMLVLESSGSDWSLSELPGVAYADE